MATRPNFIPYGIGAAPNFGGPAFPMQDSLLNPATPVPPGGGVIDLPSPVGPVAPHMGINPPGRMDMMGNRTLYTSNSRGISAISTNVHVTSHYVTDCDHTDPDSIEAAQSLRVGMVVFAMNPNGKYGRKNRMQIVDQTRSLRVQFRDLSRCVTVLRMRAGHSHRAPSPRPVVCACGKCSRPTECPAPRMHGTMLPGGSGAPLAGSLRGPTGRV
jgi:hypothetical protein